MGSLNVSLAILYNFYYKQTIFLPQNGQKTVSLYSLQKINLKNSKSYIALPFYKRKFRAKVLHRLESKVYILAYFLPIKTKVCQNILDSKNDDTLSL